MADAPQFNIMEYYGLKPVDPKSIPISRELTTIRNAKVHIVDSCNAMIQLLDTIKLRARNATESDDFEQECLMLGFEGVVQKARESVERAVNYGWI